MVCVCLFNRGNHGKMLEETISHGLGDDFLKDNLSLAWVRLRNMDTKRKRKLHKQRPNVVKSGAVFGKIQVCTKGKGMVDARSGRLLYAVPKSRIFIF